MAVRICQPMIFALVAKRLLVLCVCVTTATFASAPRAAQRPAAFPLRHTSTSHFTRRHTHAQCRARALSTVLPRVLMVFALAAIHLVGMGMTCSSLTEACMFITT